MAPWSSACAQLGIGDDGLTEVGALRERVPDFAALLAAAEDAEATMRLRRAESVGRPIGSAQFLEQLERRYERTLRREKPGPRRWEQLSALSP